MRGLTSAQLNACHSLGIDGSRLLYLLRRYAKARDDLSALTDIEAALITGWLLGTLAISRKEIDQAHSSRAGDIVFNQKMQAD